MKCPKCSNDLVKGIRHGIEVDYCQVCKGMWLDYQELDQLEDEALDQDDLKGTMIFSSSPTAMACPHCTKSLKRFKYRLYDLELEFCENKHGFWLDENEEERVLELMRKTERNLERKYQVEDKWARTLTRMRSGSFLSRLRNLFK